MSETSKHMTNDEIGVPKPRVSRKPLDLQYPITPEGVRTMVDALAFIDQENYGHRSDILYLVTKGLYLFREGKVSEQCNVADLDTYFERVSEIATSLNKDLDATKHFKDFQIKSYKNYIANTVEECLCIAFSLCRFYPYRGAISRYTGTDELMASLATSLIPEENRFRTAYLLSELVDRFDIKKDTLQSISRIRYNLFCQKP